MKPRRLLDTAAADKRQKSFSHVVTYGAAAAAATTAGCVCRGSTQTTFLDVSGSSTRIYHSLPKLRSAAEARSVKPTKGTSSTSISTAAVNAAVGSAAFGLALVLADKRRQKHRASAILRRDGSSDGESCGPVAWKGGRIVQSSLPFRPDGQVDYESIDRTPVSQVLMGTVRNLLAESAGHDSPTPGYDGVIELVREVNDMEGTAEELQLRARKVFENILPSLYIGWVPPLWKQYVQPNLPSWSTNFSFFVVFYTLFPWLMGPMEGEDFIDVEVPKSLRSVLFFLPETVRVPQSVKAERCRFLEKANCASVCVNTCKVPSQGWLKDDFGMELHIQPNYDDFSCRWRFGVPAPPLQEDEAVMVPCFTACPSVVKGTKDALSRREQMRADAEAAELAASNERLAKAIAELTPDGTALSQESLEDRVQVVKGSGKCWSVDANRVEERSKLVAK
eukprot:TRINITY_DN40068_c0_g1_i1.p1 TRINITY_DN40068_c0_g1~~TRINITY_DN40068_c0_g1_i1.p1  ORF type:complete len:450 (-),score=68.19 TRINITY_DN40068_c0_g1_i1:87-1436(-)